MISAGDFKKGTTFMMDNSICQVIEFQHVKPGKGPAFVRVKYRNLDSGSVIERSAFAYPALNGQPVREHINSPVHQFESG